MQKKTTIHQIMQYCFLFLIYTLISKISSVTRSWVCTSPLGFQPSHVTGHGVPRIWGGLTSLLQWMQEIKDMSNLCHQQWPCNRLLINLHAVCQLFICPDGSRGKERWKMHHNRTAKNLTIAMLQLQLTSSDFCISFLFSAISLKSSKFYSSQ